MLLNSCYRLEFDSASFWRKISYTTDMSYPDELGHLYHLLRPYFEHRAVVDKPQEIVRIWQEVLRYAHSYPHLREDIAELAVSATASSPLLGTNSLCEAIHQELGALEVSSGTDVEADWLQVENHIKELRAEV